MLSSVDREKQLMLITIKMAHQQQDWRQTFISQVSFITEDKELKDINVSEDIEQMCRTEFSWDFISSSISLQK